MSMTIQLDERAIASLARSSDIRTALMSGADEILTEAQSLARNEFYETGAYLAGLRVKPVTLPGGVLSGQVQSTDYKSHWAEFGWTDHNGVHHPPKAILRRAAEAAGFTPTLLPK
jgi:hypothetical protein